jgi:hypothetical protein
VGAVDVIILHPLPGRDGGPLVTALAEARAALADELRARFLPAGVDRAEVVAGVPDRQPFGARLQTLLAGRDARRGLVLLGSGALPLATPRDLADLVVAAAAPDRRALANNRYSADVLALSVGAVKRLRRLPPDFPGDNALPRWLAEAAGVRVGDLRGRWRLAMDLDSPLDVILVAATTDRGARRPVSEALRPAAERLADRVAAVRAVLADRRAELVIAGRTSAATLRWLEGHARCRVRALVEERGLRAASRLALADPASGSSRPPRSILGTLLDRDGPGALGARLAELGDAALVDTRVLLAHRLGADEAAWPTPEARFAADLLDPGAVDDPWLAELAASAAAASIPVLLGGHSLVGPGVRLIGSVGADQGAPGRRTEPGRRSDGGR